MNQFAPPTQDQLLAISVNAGIEELAQSERFAAAEPDMVEAIEFPDLSNRYQVQGVPRTVINDNFHMEGAAPEPMLLGKLQEAVA